MAEEQLRLDALEYHEFPTPGKISIAPTKTLANQRDLSLAYSPGVAYACTAIQHDPSLAARYTARANLVAVITNGSAVLGLGNIGALAGKPVMEGKGCLFKKFAGIDVFDIEIGESDPDKIVDVVAALEPTFGGINLEDIKAPECFYIEKKLRERMKIPVFHDDQHGTAIVAAAAVLNGLKIVDKDIGKVKLVCSGAGAAAIACLDLQVSLGLDRSEHLRPRQQGRDQQAAHEPRRGQGALRAEHAGENARRRDRRVRRVPRASRTGGVLTPEMVKRMADRPIILAMANPEPEIRPELAKAARPDCLIGTGRSDYPNQVNNSLCFPFIFRGALDCGATKINEEMKLAAEQRARRARARRAVGHRGARVRRSDAAVRPRLPDPARVRSAPHHDDRARGGARRRWTAASRRVRSRISRRITTSWRASCTSRARRWSRCSRRRRGAEARRVRRRRGRARAARRAGGRRRRARAAGAGRPHRHHREPHPEARPAAQARQGLRRRQHPRRSALPRLLDRVLQARAAQGRRRAAQAQEDMRTRPTLVAAMLVHRGDADAMLCGTGSNSQRHLRYIRAGDRRARRCEDDGRDADADPAGPPALHLRHARQSRSRRPRRSRR